MRRIFLFLNLLQTNLWYDYYDREEEGVKLMNQMKKRFSATISETMRAMIQNGDDASIDLVIYFINLCVMNDIRLYDIMIMNDIRYRNGRISLN